MQGRPRSKANDRLTLELNYQSEDVKSDRNSERHGRQGLAIYPPPGPRQIINAENMCRVSNIKQKIFVGFPTFASLSGKGNENSLLPIPRARAIASAPAEFPK
jgi:hypothetical protein